MTSGSFIRVSAWAGTFETLRRPMRRERHRGVEGQEHRIEEVAPDVQVDAPPAVAVERARVPRAAAAVHERRQVDGTLGPNIVGSSRPETASSASRIASASSRRTFMRCR